jgi:hypothetical protein
MMIAVIVYYKKWLRCTFRAPNMSMSLQTLAFDVHLAEGQFLHDKQTLNNANNIIQSVIWFGTIFMVWIVGQCRMIKPVFWHFFFRHKATTTNHEIETYFFIMPKSHEKCPLWPLSFLYNVFNSFHNPLNTINSVIHINQYFYHKYMCCNSSIQISEIIQSIWQSVLSNVHTGTWSTQKLSNF